MKKLVALALVVALVTALVAPTAALAKGNDDGGRKGAQKYAIVIGISNYPGPKSVIDNPPGLDLFYSDNDARLVKQVLMQNYGFSPSHINMLLNADATQLAILRAIASVKDEVDRNDEVVFYFSGHSFRPEELGYPAFLGNVGLMVWSVAGKPAMIWDRELNLAFAGFRTSKITFIFDSCSSAGFSGLAVNGRLVIAATDNDGVSGEYGKAYSQVFPIPPEYLEFLPPGFATMSHGFFTYFFFVVGIQNGMAPDTINPDGKISLQEAFLVANDGCSTVTALAGSMGIDEIPFISDPWGDTHL